MKLPGYSTWSQAVCKDKVAPRSCEVECNGRTYHRNQKDLSVTPEQLTPAASSVIDVEVPATQLKNDIPNSELRSEVSDTSASYSNSPVSETVTSSPVRVSSRGRVIKATKNALLREENFDFKIITFYFLKKGCCDIF